ncbi:MAG: glutamate formiminotransferase [Actinobacteria bacterium]|nr:glutamate formiminotransferase [Actinomycetota bacterium]
MLECVVNISEGRDDAVIAAVADAAGRHLLDVHTDPHHHRSVLTLVGEDAARSVTVEAVARIDLRTHVGVHPRIGAVDVVPFVPLAGSTLADAAAARDRYCDWAARELDLPCFTYGPERTLPDVRREAFRTLAPATGPLRPHPTAGAVAVGARPLLVAYNVWLAEPDLALARRIAAEVRQPAVRALGLAVGERVQVSMNLVDPGAVGPAEATDLVAARAPVAGCELVGLVPEAVLAAVAPQRWAALDLGADRTIEERLGRALGGGLER